MTDFAPFEQKMRSEGLPALAIDTFRHYFELLVGGDSGLVPEADIEPAREVPDLASLSQYEVAGRAALARAVVIKLNGGLATSMGMTRAKSLLPVKGGHSFLDIIARQIKYLRAEADCALPLLLMNSFRTRDDSLAALAPHDLELPGLPLDFVQHKIPRIASDGMVPVAWPKAPEHEWCPPGHGDIYTALVTSGALDALRAAGHRYAFVANADNLGATLDLTILGWMASESVPFAMEVTDRTRADRKGGHLAIRRGDGQLVLRELAQCPPADVDAFQDVATHRYFNTNNLWLDLDALDATLRARDHVLGLPMIQNEKRADPLDDSSPKCIQLETAMGAAIASFAGARALRVPRTRFAPVKTTSDLLVVMSDAYELTPDERIVRAEGVAQDLVVELDDAFYKRIDQFEERFASGAPSLRACHSLAVRGDVRFGAGVELRGDVRIRNEASTPLTIGDGERIEG